MPAGTTDQPDWFTATPMSVPDGELAFSKSGEQFEVEINNGAMGFEDFYAAVSDGTPADAFQIEPTSGTLNRRGQDPTYISIKYMGGAKGDDFHLVVQTEEEKWSFKITLP